MPFGAAALFASAFCHALWNAMLKRERAPQVAVAGVLAWAAVVALGVALVTGGVTFVSRAALLWGIAAGVFEGVYFVTLAAALARADYGIVYTVARGGAMLLVWPAGTLLLREPVTALGVLGAAVVALGLVLVTGRATGQRGQRGGIAFAAACASSIAAYHLCYDRALALGTREAPLFTVAVWVALPLVFASLRGRIDLRAAAATGVAATTLRWGIAGGLSTASFLLFLTGLASTGAAVALTLRNTSIFFAQALSIVLGERPTRLQLLGAAMVAMGAALVVPR